MDDLCTSKVELGQLLLGHVGLVSQWHNERLSLSEEDEYLISCRIIKRTLWKVSLDSWPFCKLNHYWSFDDSLFGEVINHVVHFELTTVEHVYKNVIVLDEACIHHRMREIVIWARLVVKTNSIVDTVVTQLMCSTKYLEVEYAIFEIRHTKDAPTTVLNNLVHFNVFSFDVKLLLDLKV